MHRLIAIYGKVTSIVQAITRNRDSGREPWGGDWVRSAVLAELKKPVPQTKLNSG